VHVDWYTFLSVKEVWEGGGGDRNNYAENIRYKLYKISSPTQPDAQHFCAPRIEISFPTSLHSEWSLVMTYFQAQYDCGSSLEWGCQPHLHIYSHYIKTWGFMPQGGVFCNLLLSKSNTYSSLQKTNLNGGSIRTDTHHLALSPTHFTLHVHAHTKNVQCRQIETQCNIRNKWLAALWHSGAVSVQNPMKIY
jgi:hypothetical protein